MTPERLAELEQFVFFALDAAADDRPLSPEESVALADAMRELLDGVAIVALNNYELREDLLALRRRCLRVGNELKRRDYVNSWLKYDLARRLLRAAFGVAETVDYDGEELPQRNPGRRFVPHCAAESGRPSGEGTNGGRRE